MLDWTEHPQCCYVPQGSARAVQSRCAEPSRERRPTVASDDARELADAMLGHFEQMLGTLKGYIDEFVPERSEGVSDSEWRGFLSEHRELGVTFTDDELLQALRDAIGTTEHCPTRPTTQSLNGSRAPARWDVRVGLLGLEDSLGGSPDAVDRRESDAARKRQEVRRRARTAGVATDRCHRSLVPVLHGDLHCTPLPNLLHRSNCTRATFGARQGTR